MNTAFSGNRVQGYVSLDIAGSYPTGLLAALATYSDPAELINAQLRFTAAQVDINAKQDAEYALRNLQMEQTATLSPTSLKSQLAAITYKDASYQVNYANNNVSNKANTAYTNANAVLTQCRNASYLGYLTHEATQVVVDRISTAIIVTELGNSTPNVNPYDATTLSTISTVVASVEQIANNNTILAQDNANDYLIQTRLVLNNAINVSNSVTNNLTLVSRFKTLVKSILENIADPLSYIAGKELLVTQYVPSVPLNNAIDVTTLAIASLQKFIKALSENLQTTPDITASVLASDSLADSLDLTARQKDIIMDLTDAVARVTIQSASNTRANGAPISYPNIYPLNPYRVSLSTISTAQSAKKVALYADTSAVNARTVSNALFALQAAFALTDTPEPMISVTANSSLKFLNDMLNALNKVTSNSSAYSAVAITRRAYNTIAGYLEKISEEETLAVNASTDAKSVLTLLNAALSLSNVSPNMYNTQKLLWAVNAAKGRAEEVYEKLKNDAYISSRTAHNLVTPQTIAIQTSAANTAGALNNNRASRLDRNSRNVPVDPPAAYKSYKADIRAKTFYPVRPTLDELVYKNRLHPLRLDSLRTILDTKVKIAQDVQRIKDNSAFSFRQQ